MTHDSSPDASPRKRVVQPMAQLQTRDEWLRLAADSAQLGFWHWNEETNRLFWDRRIREIFGVNLDGDVTLGTFYRAVHPEDLPRVRTVWRRAMETGQSCELEYRALRRDGSVRWINARGRGCYSASGEPLSMIGVVVDATDRKLVEQERVELSGRLIQAQEQERRRLGRELHDDFCQRLATKAVQLQTMRTAVRDAAAAALIDDVTSAFAALGQDLQGLSHQLYSPRLEILGLIPSIAALCADIARQHRVDIEFAHGNRPCPLAGDAALSLYRIVQEALRNVVRHSGASKVTLRLDADREIVSLTVADNGGGFDPPAESAAHGIGVLSMKERARILGGTCDIRSGPRPRGTTVTVTIPAAAESGAFPSPEGSQ